MACFVCDGKTEEEVKIRIGEKTVKRELCQNCYNEFVFKYWIKS